MLKLKDLSLGLSLMLSSAGCMGYIVDGARVHQPKLLSYASEQLPNQGTIEQTDDGLTYLKIPEQYITALIKHLPAYSNQANDSKIDIIEPTETAKSMKIQELGRTVNFRPLGFYTVVENDKEYFRLAIDAPELSALRAKYGLSKQLDNQAFHITIGVRELKYHNELNP